MKEKLPNPVSIIISGGQSGADLAGNEFARAQGIKTCCYVFEGFKPVNKEDEPVLASFTNLYIKVTRPDDYVNCLRERTIHNVKRADATILFINRPLEETRGSRLTWKMAEVMKKPLVIVHLSKYLSEGVEQISEFITLYQPKILNIAGERTLDRKKVIQLLERAWKRI